MYLAKYHPEKMHRMAFKDLKQSKIKIAIGKIRRFIKTTIKNH
jgi:hypothetical protein